MIKTTLKHLIAALLFLLPGVNSYSQEGNLFFMDAAPQNSFYNPAIQYNRSLALVSLTGYLDVKNNTFAFKNFFNTNEVSQNNYWDLGYLSRNSKAYTNANTEVFYTLAYGGLKMKNGYYLSFYLNRKYNYSFVLPDDFFNLSLGNANYELEQPRQFNLDKTSANLSSHLEYTFGISKEIHHDFRLGIHLKVLNGLNITKFDNALAKISTADDFSEVVINADLQIQQSAPGANDSISAYSLSSEVLGFKNIFRNWGAAVDLGFWYKPSHNFTIMGSVTDLGFINWRVDNNLLQIKNEFTLDGINIFPVDTGIVVNSSFDGVQDTLSSLFSPTSISNSNFSTNLYSNVYLAAKWQVTNPLSFYALYRAKGLIKYAEHYFTAGAQYNASKNIRLSVTTSVKNRTALNLGAGFLWEFKQGQFFVMSENIESAFMAGRNANIMFGVNYIIWQKIHKRNYSKWQKAR